MPKRKILILVAIVLATLLCFAAGSFGDELDDKRSEIDDVQVKIDEISGSLEAAQDKYNAAMDAKENARKQQDEIDSEIARLEEQVAVNKEHLGQRAKWTYKNGGVGLLDILLSDDTLSDFIDDLAYVSSLNRGDMAIVDSIRSQERQLEEHKAAYAEEEARAEEAEAVAKEIKDSVQVDMDELETTLGGLQAEERKMLGYIDGIDYTEISTIPPNGTVVDYALSRKGCPYVWGAAGPESFDCSGLVMWSYAQVGIYLPHNSEAQYEAADEILPLSQAMPGDVLWRNGHVGICTEPGATKYVHAPTFGAVVRDTDDPSWSGFVCALRFG